MMTKDVAYFCPECGGASVESMKLVGSSAHCKTCGWEGSNTQLVAYSFEHEFSDGAEAVRYLMNDLRRVYAAAAKLLGEFLMKWGFLDVVETKEGVTLNSKQLSRYVAAIAQATMKAIVKERAKMEQEKISGRASGN
jgi:hypothetical protein